MSLRCGPCTVVVPAQGTFIPSSQSMPFETVLKFYNLEARYRGDYCHIINRKEARYKIHWSGNSKGTTGVGVFVVRTG